MSNVRTTAVGPCGSGIVPAAFAFLAPLVTLLLGIPAAQGAEKVTGLIFNRDIRPILAENCLRCHGPDPGSRKAGLRLDTQEGMFGKAKGDKVIVVPGHPEQSELWRRITTTDADDHMPPKDSHKELSAPQLALLKQWVEAGAPWQAHWSFLPPQRPTPPNTVRQNWVRNPIDAFVLARLEANGLTPAPEAGRRALARRVALDLTGLPPTPSEVERFVKDSAPDAYERLVDRLLASPHWGEHRARFWLDAARYADTHGLHFDNYREMWPYRDWVIRAFNRNLPFDQFTLLQLAGDLLPDANEESLVASGFHRCNMTTNEGGTIEDENLANYARDRVETTSLVWLGITAGCASCHDHKFDPMTMRDFYSLAAFYRNTTQGGYDGNVKNSSPSIPVFGNPIARARWLELEDSIKSARKEVDERRKDSDKAAEGWIQTLATNQVALEVQRGLVTHLPLNESNLQTVTYTTRGHARTLRLPVQPNLDLRKEGKTGPALILDRRAPLQFPGIGDLDSHRPFTVAAWVYLPSEFHGEASLVGRTEKSPGGRGWDLWHEFGHLGFRLVHDWPADAIQLRTQGRVARRGGWQHLCVTSDGSGTAEGIQLFFDGGSQDLEIHHANRLSGSIRSAAPLQIGGRSTGAILDGGSVQDVRIFDRALAPSEVSALYNRGWTELLAKARKDWKEDDGKGLTNYFFAQHFEAATNDRTRLNILERERRAIYLHHPVTHVQKEKMDSEATANILFRGAYDKPRDKVSANTPAFLHAMPPKAPRNRLGLAQWLISPENPLTSRVVVNRFWQEVFGVGIIRTSEDLGVMGEAPSHPELLDWLAVEFRESGWDVRHLFRLMVTSEAYRQSIVTTPEKLQKDPGNRLLSRGPRFRMDAEMVRDYALAASGLISSRVGGASVRGYQPEGVWEAVAMPESNTRYYRRETGESLYRRSLYTFWKRAAPPPVMDLFNAPSRESCTVRRERTNTPLQALATLNDPQFVEASRRLAETAHRDAGHTPGRALDLLASRVLLRPLESEERQWVEETYQAMLKHYRNAPEDATALLAVGEAPLQSRGPKPELAALTMVANQLLNLDEALNK